MKGVLTIEKVAAAYAVLTFLLMAVLWPQLVEPWAILRLRLWWLVMTVLLVIICGWVRRRLSGNKRVCITADFMRVAGQLAWLRFWYSDIYEFNRIRSNLDHVFAAADQWLFGCQPSLTFCQWLSGSVWSELFNLGYWSYFPMIALLVVAVWWKSLGLTSGPSPVRERRFTAANGSNLTSRGRGGEVADLSAVILASFFLYYLIFLLLPVAGPQFYFQAVGVDEIVAGHFPALGTYFCNHTEMLPAPGNPDGLFYQLVTHSQEIGERPIAAFPSSHIGVSTIVLMLSRRYLPRLTWYFIPFWFLLCCATVYIQAHYLVDAIAGLFSAPLVMAIATKLVQLPKDNSTIYP